ncbi:fructoselysine-6-P-deglycase FrlB-like protein [Sphingomonas sp. PvP055]
MHDTNSDTSTVKPGPTLMFLEAEEAHAAVERMLAANAAAFAQLGATLRAAPPSLVVTCARGSSDHAATYAKYMIETRIGILVASAAPSVASVYAAPVARGNALCIAISQSGRSPDLLATVTAQKTAGAHVVAIVNDTTSPLAEMADTLIALSAGVERSVAATKSYITSLAAIAALVAEWSQEASLQTAVAALPGLLRRSWAFDWQPVGTALQDANNLFVIGRGIGLAVRAGSRAQAQGNLRPPCRGVQFGRSAPRSDGDRRAGLPDHRLRDLGRCGR